MQGAVEGYSLQIFLFAGTREEGAGGRDRPGAAPMSVVLQSHSGIPDIEGVRRKVAGRT